MKKRLLATLCILIFCLALAPPGAWAAGETVYILALNDKFADDDVLNAATMPVAVGGTIYIPYTTFDWRTTDVNLGVYYGQQDGMLTLYDKERSLRFDVVNNLCADGAGNLMEFRAITRNGKIYVPYSAVCNFFGLSSYYQPSEEGGVLIRICNGSERINNDRFFGLTQGVMRDAYNKYMQALNPQVTPAPTQKPSVKPTPSPSPTESPAPGQPEVAPGENDRSGVRVYLAFRCENGMGMQEILDTLEGNGVRGLFFFQPEDLVSRSGEVRALVGAGHAIGLMGSGETLEEVQTALDTGNGLLQRIAWTRTHTTLVDSGDLAIRTELEQQGWRCWQENINGIPTGDRAAGNADRVLRAVDAKRAVAWVTLDDSAATAQALPRILTGLREEKYSIRLAIETELSE